MQPSKAPEVWLRGPLPGISPYLQPIAHALLQAREEVNELVKNFPEEYLWNKPSGLASVGFHLQHLTGVLDRLFTYAKGEALSAQQFEWLNSEGKPIDQSFALSYLTDAFNQKTDWAIKQLGNINEQTLLAYRPVGRAQLPSTVLGLLTHAAEHTMRHVGQLLVTVRIQLDLNQNH